MVFLGEEHVFSSLAFSAVFREVGCISVECKYHVTVMVSDGSVRMGCYVVKDLVTCAED